MFDSVRLNAELAHIHRALLGVAASPRGKGMVDHLRAAISGTTTSALVQQALLADCMRVIHGAMTADGEISDPEIDALHDVLAVAARHYAHVVPGYVAFAMIDAGNARVFLAHYAADRGPFGREAATRWPGLNLCQRTAALGERDAIERYEQTMGWLIAEACRVGGVAITGARGRDQVDDLEELRQTLPRRGVSDGSGVDRRIQAFLAPSGVFTAVQQPTSIFENDPFDVEAVHREARESFEQLVKRARTPSPIVERGRMLLVLGDSGCGKTHVLRGFRRHVQEFGRGFVAYAQMQSNSVNYERHLLHELVNSLTRPYAGPSGERTGLQELASGLLQLTGKPLQARVQQLIDDSWEEDQDLTGYVNDLTRDIIREGSLEDFDPDLLRVMLYALRPDRCVTAAVYKYLRCENMNPHDLHWIGNVVPRTDEDHPYVMIKQIGRLASLTQRALVLMVDQADLTGFDPESGGKLFKRAVDALYHIVSEVSSAIAVVACLSDLYDVMRPALNKPALDRLEKDPETVRLKLNRTYPEIEAIVARRLAWLFAEHRTEYQPESPVYPIPKKRLEDFQGSRTRDVLEWCHEFQSQCAAMGGILDEDGNAVMPLRRPEADLDQIAAAWNEALRDECSDISEDDNQILIVIGAAANAYAQEAGLQVTESHRDNKLFCIALSNGTDSAELAISVTNNNYHRGSFAGQINSLRKQAGNAIAIAVRTGPFPRGDASTKVIDELINAGGRKLYIDVPTLQVLVTLQRFQPPFAPDRIAAWFRRDRPISTLSAVADVFKFDAARAQRIEPAEPAPEAAAGPLQPAMAESRDEASAGEPAPLPPPPSAVPVAHDAPRQLDEAIAQPPKRAARRQTPRGVPTQSAQEESSSLRAAGSIPPPTADPVAAPFLQPAPVTRSAPVATYTKELQLGTDTALSNAEPRTIEIDTLLGHTAIVGTTGCGRATLSLNVIEQVLERDVATIVLDGSGELAGYADPVWWQRATDPDRAERLAGRIDVRLFTPGAREGRPLALQVAPNLEGVAPHERDRRIRDAAMALTATLRSGGSVVDAAHFAILNHAVAVLAERAGERRLGELISLVEDRDAALVARTGGDAAAFEHLARGLRAMQQNDALFEPSAEVLSMEALVGRGPDGKVPLAIISLRHLGEVPRIQAWVAHLIGCLSHHVETTPSRELRAILLVDDAHVFLPAGATKTPSKDALNSLLKRGTTGLGVILSSSNPSDIDYKGHASIRTWFLGRIDAAAIDKMRPLLEGKPPIAGKLRIQERGRFVMLQGGSTTNLQRTPSMMRRTPIADDELLSLAAQSKPATPSSSRSRQGRAPRTRSPTPRPSAT